MVPMSGNATADDADSRVPQRAQAKPRKLTTRPGKKDTAVLLQRQPSQKMTARDQRNISPWQTPFAADTPPAENLLRDYRNDSRHDEVFFRAYYDPSFQRILADWNDELSTKHQRTAPSQEKVAPSAATFGTRDGKTPETCFDVMVMGQPKVGKTTFIARCLGIDVSEVNPPRPREVEFHGQTYWFRIRERSLGDIDARKPETLKGAHEKWESNPERIDGVFALYDLTEKTSVDPLPIAMRAVQQTGKPCVLASTKADCSFSRRQLNPDGVEKKVKLVVGKLKSVKPSADPAGPRKCLHRLFLEIAKVYKLTSPPTSRPQSKASFQKLQSATQQGHSRPHSKSSLAPGKDQKNNYSASLSFHQSHTPLPHYIAVAVDAANQCPPSDAQASPGAEPFSPLSPHPLQHGESIMDSDQASSGTSEEPNPDVMRAVPSHILELNTFEELLARVCFRDNIQQDTKFDFNFLTFYRFFASPLRLLQALISVYETASTAKEPGTTDVLPGRVLQFLSQWVTTHPGDFAYGDTYQQLEDFLETFCQKSPFFPVAEQIRMACGKVDEDDDCVWSPPDATFCATGVSVERKGSQASASTKSVSELDAKLIFQAHSTLTVEAMGPSNTNAHTHVHTSSVDQSTIPYNITTVAQRQSALLDPSSQLPFTKIQWRQLMGHSDAALAREMTRIDWIMFSAIQPRDMIRHITVPAPDRGRFHELSNVTRWVEHFNHIAYWTTNVILLRDKPKHRALALEKLILVARRLRELNNYNSLGAIIAGIQGTAVHRLTATREQVPTDVQKNLMKMELLMSTQKGHSAYRLAWENSTGARIPFLPLHRRDLVVAEQGNKTWITIDGIEGEEAKRINWNKFKILGAMLWDLYDAQSTPYSGFLANEGIKKSILESGIIKNDDRLYDRSQALEPSNVNNSGSSARRRLAPWLARYGL